MFSLDLFIISFDAHSWGNLVQLATEYSYNAPVFNFPRIKIFKYNYIANLKNAYKLGKTSSA